MSKVSRFREFKAASIGFSERCQLPLNSLWSTATSGTFLHSQLSADFKLKCNNDDKSKQFKLALYSLDRKS